MTTTPTAASAADTDQSNKGAIAAAPGGDQRQQPQIRTVRLRDIVRDPDLQARAAVDVETIGDYAQAFRDGVTFPAIKLVDADGALLLADGWHRAAGAEAAGVEELQAEITVGTRRDALLMALAANANHGLRRTTADKRRAVEKLLHDPEWAKWSDREIARKLAVDHKTVAAVRRSLLTGEIPGDTATARTYVTKHGTTATMDIGGIARKPTPAAQLEPTDTPPASLPPAEAAPAPAPPAPTEAAHAEPVSTPAEAPAPTLALNTPAAVNTPPATLPSASAPVDPAGPPDTPSSASAPAASASEPTATIPAPAPAPQTPGAVLAQIHAAFVAGLQNSLHATPVQSDPKTGRELVALSTVLVPGRDEISSDGLGAIGWIAAELNSMPWVDKFPLVVPVDCEPIEGERGVRAVFNSSQHDFRIAARALQAAYLAGEDPLQALDMLMPGIEADAPRARAVIGYLRRILSAHITLAMDGPAPVGDKDAEIRRLNFALVDEINRANIWRLTTAESSAALVACHASLKRLGRKLK